jgi:hypothetical protein
MIEHKIWTSELSLKGLCGLTQNIMLPLPDSLPVMVTQCVCVCLYVCASGIDRQSFTEPSIGYISADTIFLKLWRTLEPLWRLQFWSLESTMFGDQCVSYSWNHFPTMLSNIYFIHYLFKYKLFKITF